MSDMKRTIIRIGNVADIGRGSSPRPITDKKYFENGEIPWIKIADATASGKKIYITKEYVNDVGASYSRKMKPGTLILSASGVSLGIPHFLGVEGCIHDGWIYMDNIHDIDKQYLYYLLLTMRPYFDNLSYGAAIQNINTTILSKTKIEVPGIQSQEKIGLILSAYDNLIENNNKRIKLLEQMAENLYKEWFVRFRFPGYEDVEFEGKSPKGWNKLRLNQFGIQLESGARPQGGINSLIDDGVPSLGAESVKGLAEFDYSDVKLIPEEFYHKLKRGKNRGNHILIYKDGAYIGKITLFKYGFPFERFAINEHVFFMNSIRSEYQNYLYFTLKQTSYFTLMQNLNRNAAQPGLSQLDLNRIRIIEPDQVTVVRFNDIVEPILKEVFLLAKKNHLLIKQRDMLLPRLMSGKLEV